MQPGRGRPVNWTRVVFGQCEEGLDNVLRIRYKNSDLAPLVVLQEILSSEGIRKLITLILSPFPVGIGTWF